MRFDIITIFPKIFDSYFNESIIKRAREKKLVDIRIHNLRDFARDRRKTTDDKPYGGGVGMVMRVEPILRAVDSIPRKKRSKIVVLSAKGRQFNQKLAYEWSKKVDQLVLISGRYEGIDERVIKALSAKGGSASGGKAEEISIGPYITTDGDVAAMVAVSALTRLIPKVINWSSLEDESFLQKTISHEAKTGELEYPHYTRPEVLKYKNKLYRVPKVLLSGNHKKIEEWRQKMRRP